MPARYWPKLTSELLGTEAREKVSSFLPKLKRAQTEIWKALNYFDDVLDEGITDNLVPGLRSYRSFLSEMFRIPCDGLAEELKQQSRKFENGLITELNNNRKKVNATRRISFPPLYSKSCLLILAPLAVCYLADLPASKTSAVRKYFQFALNAKQLSDDCADWKEDLAKGRSTSVGDSFLRLAKRNGLKKITLDSLESDLIFARDLSPKLSMTILKYCSSARSAISHLGGNALLAKRMLSPLEKAAQDALAFRCLLTE